MIHTVIFIRLLKGQRANLRRQTAPARLWVRPSLSCGEHQKNRLISWNSLNWPYALAMRKREGQAVKGSAWQRGKGRERSREKGQPVTYRLCGLWAEDATMLTGNN